MSICRHGTAFIVTAVEATALVGGTAVAALATEPLGSPSVLSVDLLSAEGSGCSESAVRLGDGWLDVQAKTGGDESLMLDGREASGQHSIEVQCLLHTRVYLDRPARVKASQYLMSGSVSTSAGTEAGHRFESSWDNVSWYGQQSVLSPGSTGPFHRGGGSRFAPTSACGTEVDVSFRVGLTLSSADELAAHDRIALDAPNGATAELVTDASACPAPDNSTATSRNG